MSLPFHPSRGNASRQSLSGWHAFWLIVVLLSLLGLTGCEVSRAALPPLPTRTLRPTFTPTATEADPPPAQPTPTPTEPVPTPTLPPLPTVVPQEGHRIEPTPTPQPPTRVPPSSPAATLVPPTGRFILVDQDQQQMYIFENGVEIRAIPCSTGDPHKHGTAAWQGVVGDYVGTIFSFGMYADYAWFLFKDQGSILIHGAPYLIEEDGTKTYYGLEALGRYPDSHGCIRIHPDEARWFTFWNPKGVPIVITPWTGGSRLQGTTDH